ncbi:phospholipase D-like domain-containing protein DpdK [Sphaerimonospora thailandensis]|uniref:Phospholipase D-like protein n=1 Tax=Sphaerimonospora thailandensis TaxID=795644 RepID=A0A8J3W1E0_9ACTN|nr:phospholipase D-like domain-containing protein DpdK [Sphaerimonospora thailandensis]GIH72018.1 hypothetical protein Mth01_42710 [Sphaerimonospora thailandensis]
MSLERTVRTGNNLGLRVDDIVGTALIGELLDPGKVLWVVSGWISDVKVLDNSQGAFDSILGDDPPSVCRLSHMLALIAAAGAKICVATRHNPHNTVFIEHLNEVIRDKERLRIIRDPNMHEKTLCGNGWIMTGSMNFTISGMGDSEESVTYRTSDPSVAQAHIDFRARWKESE